MMRCYLKDEQKTWDENIQLLAGALRSTVNRQTGFSANMMLFGREINQPVDIILGTASVNQNHNSSPADHVTKLRETLSKVHTVARDCLHTSQMRQKRDYDLRLKESKYNIGDLVYQIDSATKLGQCSKLRPIWKGPYVVSQVLSPMLYKIVGRKHEKVVHHDRLKICVDRNVPIWISQR
jgi:hypothetical protein